MKRLWGSIPYFSKDVLFCIASRLSVTDRLPLRVISRQMERAVNMSITELEFHNDADLEIVGPKFPNLRKVTTSTLKGLQHLPCLHITELSINYHSARIPTSEDATTISSIFPVLEKLYCTKISTPFLQSLQSDSLLVLDGFYGRAMTKEFIVSLLCRIPNLREFNVDCAMTNSVECIKYIAQNTCITSVKHLRISTKFLEHLPESVTAMELDDDTQVEKLTRFKQLKALTIVNEEQIQAIGRAQITGLTSLYVLRDSFGPTNVDHYKLLLRNNPKISHFHVEKMSLYNAGCFAPWIQNVQHLYIGCGNSDENNSIRNIALHCKRLTQITFGHNPGEWMLQVIAALPFLKRVWFCDCIKEPFMNRLATLCTQKGILLKLRH